MMVKQLKFFFIFLALFITLSPAETYPAKAKVPIDMDIYIDGVYQVGGELVVTVTTRPLLPAPKIKIAINLPDGLQLNSGEIAWEGSMSKGEERDLEVTVKILKEGLFEVKGVASIEYPDGSRLVKSASGTIGVGQYQKPRLRWNKEKRQKGPVLGSLTGTSQPMMTGSL